MNPPRYAGSSPLARGLRDRVVVTGHEGGIIPARAGFTQGTKAMGWSAPDHPRSRGVYKRARLLLEQRVGSSPLARGLRPVRSLHCPRWRIIPARAGFTSWLPSRRRGHADHPRSRGVYWSRTMMTFRARGSSPLARGLPTQHARRQAGRGIIPARAGFTLADPWNPNDEPCYQTAFTFSANLEPAPPSSGSAVVLRRSTMTPSEA